MAGRHGVPDGERSRYAAAARAARTRHRERVEAGESWTRWAAWRVPVLALEVVVLVLVVRLLGQGREGWALLALVPGLAAMALLALDMRRRLVLRREHLGAGGQVDGADGAEDRAA